MLLNSWGTASCKGMSINKTERLNYSITVAKFFQNTHLVMCVYWDLTHHARVSVPEQNSMAIQQRAVASSLWRLGRRWKNMTIHNTRDASISICLSVVTFQTKTRQVFWHTIKQKINTTLRWVKTRTLWQCLALQWQGSYNRKSNKNNQN